MTRADIVVEGTIMKCGLCKVALDDLRGADLSGIEAAVSHHVGEHKCRFKKKVLEGEA